MNLPIICAEEVMAVSEATQCRAMDTNNNFSTSMKGYSLRPRTSSRKCEEEEVAEVDTWRPSRSKRKQKTMPLSKYRRKTANARERSRMREINEAFETLRRVIPQMSSRECSSEKLTKITTLRLAMKYISALSSALHDQDLGSDGESLFSDYTLTPPDVRDLSIVSPGFTDHSDLLAPLMPDELGPHLVPHSDTPSSTTPLYFETPLLPLDSLSVPLFTPVGLDCTNALDDSQFLQEFS